MISSQCSLDNVDAASGQTSVVMIIVCSASHTSSCPFDCRFLHFLSLNCCIPSKVQDRCLRFRRLPRTVVFLNIVVHLKYIWHICGLVFLPPRHISRVLLSIKNPTCHQPFLFGTSAPQQLLSQRPMCLYKACCIFLYYIHVSFLYT